MNCFKSVLLPFVFVLILVLPATTANAQAQQIHISDGLKKVNGTKLYYKVFGEGEPIVILHGGPGIDHNHLVPNVGKLSDRFQLIFYDQRGTGNSSGKIDSSKITTDTFVEDLEEIRKSFDLNQMNLMGFSWGSMLAMQYAIKYPQNLKSLILCCSMGASSDFFKPFSKNINQNWTKKDSVDLAKVMDSKAFKNQNPKAIARARKIKYRPYFHNSALAENITFNFGKNTLSNGDTIYSLLIQEYRDYNLYDELETIQSPSLIIHGDSDPIPAKYAKRIQETIPNSRFVVFKNTGHWVFIEAEKRFLDTVTDFLVNNK